MLHCNSVSTNSPKLARTSCFALRHDSDASSLAFVIFSSSFSRYCFFPSVLNKSVFTFWSSSCSRFRLSADSPSFLDNSSRIKIPIIIIPSSQPSMGDHSKTLQHLLARHVNLHYLKLHFITVMQVIPLWMNYII